MYTRNTLFAQCAGLISALLFSAAVFAGDNIYTQALTGSQIAQGFSMNLYDPQYNTMITDVNWHSDNVLIANDSRVILKYTEALHEVYTEWEITVHFDVLTWDEYGLPNAPLLNQSLTIDYDDADPYIDIRVLPLGNAHKIALSITQVDLPAGMTEAPGDVQLELEMEIERYAKMDATTALDIVRQNGASTDMIELSWEYLAGAEEYDLEWYWVSAEEETPPAWPADIDDNDYTRVTLSQNHYEMHVPLDHGQLWYRVRAVGECYDANGMWRRVEGAWSNTQDDHYWSVNPNPEKNWTYSAAYAEEGKSKQVLTFFDGTTRSRQAVTYLNSDEAALIAESFYDYEGRGVISTLPAPDATRDPALKFYESFTEHDPDNGTDPITLFDKSDFNFDQGLCDITAQKLATTNGASQYYSDQNPDMSGFNAAIPTAHKFPYTQVLHQNDGRIKRQAGPGPAHNIASEHVTEYFYATPMQEKLDRLFGNEVGHAMHYQLTATRDANGQIALSYTNLKGQVRAQSYVGEAPEGMTPLEDNTGPGAITSDLSVFSQFNDQSYDSDVAFFVEVPNTPYTFDYELSPETVAALCTSDTYDCEYDVEIRIYDNCGRPIYDNTTDPFVDDNDDALLHKTHTLNSANFYALNPIVVTFPEIGTYKIEKRLTLNQSKFQADLADYRNDLAANPCFDDYQTILADLQQGIQCDDCGSYVMDGDPAVECAWDYSMPCDVLLQIFKSDVSPGGQYYENAPDAANPNDWLENNIGLAVVNSVILSMTGTDPAYSTWNDFKADWQPWYADLLVSNHPEYCHYTFCSDSDVQASNDFDVSLRMMAAFADAQSAGYIVGNLNNPCSGNLVGDELLDYDPAFDDNTGMLDLNNLESDMLAFIQYGGNGSCLWEFACDASGCSSGCDDAWQLFVQLYLAKKTELMEVYKTNNFDCDGHQNPLSYLCDDTVPPDNVVDDCDPDLEGFDIRVPDVLGQLDDLVDVNDAVATENNVLNWVNTITVETDACAIDPEYVRDGSLTFTSNPCDQSTTIDWASNPPGTIWNDPFDWNGDNYCPVLTDLDGWDAYHTPFLSPELNGTFYLTSFASVYQGDPFCEKLKHTLQPALQANTTYRITMEVRNKPDAWQFQPPASPPTYGVIDRFGIAFFDASLDLTDPLVMEERYQGAAASELDWITLNGNGTGSDIFKMGDNLSSTEWVTVTRVVTVQDNWDMFALIHYGEQNSADVASIQYRNVSIRKYSCPPQPDCFCSELDLYRDAIASSDPALDLGGLTEAQYIANGLNSAHNLGLAGTDYTNFQTAVATWLTDCDNGNLDLGPIKTNYRPVLDNCSPPLPPCDEEEQALASYYANQMYQQLFNQQVEDWINHYQQQCFEPTPTGLFDETFDVSYQDREYQYTLYYYDQAGNVTRTVPPEGVELIPENQWGDVASYRAGLSATAVNTTHRMATTYNYNTLNEIVLQRTPDTDGDARFFYDKLGRIVASQDPLQATNDHFSYTTYDAQGRPEESGQLLASADPTFSELNDAAFPAGWGGGRHEMRLTQYDEPDGGSIQALFGASGQNNLRQRVTSMQYKENEADANYQHATHYSYDEHGNAETVIQENTLFHEGTKRIDYTYDLINGNVNEVHYQAGEADQFIHRYCYDADNRLIEVHTSQDNIIWDKDATYYYNLHGPLARVEIGDKKVQGNDYAYTIQGWLKGINSNVLAIDRDLGKDGLRSTTASAFYDPANPDLHDDVACDAFGFTLGYFHEAAGNTDYTPISLNSASWTDIDNFHSDVLNQPTSASTGHSLYNGNIRQMATALMDTEEEPIAVAAANYRYDQLNRFRMMEVGLDNGQQYANANPNLGAYHTSVDYDRNGNITNLWRAGSTDPSLPGSISGVNMDDFTYEYQPGGINNRLFLVNDAISGDPFSTDLESQGALGQGNQNYDYDENGQLTEDLAEDIQLIEWTVDGKVKRVTRNNDPTTNSADLEFRYDAAGNRISKIVKPRVAGVLSNQDEWTLTHYTRDATGNIMAVYEQSYADVAGIMNDRTKLLELPVYGSKRLGLKNVPPVVLATDLLDVTGYNSDGTFIFGQQTYAPLPKATGTAMGQHARGLGSKQYELSNHLGNVLATVSDRLLYKDVTTAGFSGTPTWNSIGSVYSGGSIIRDPFLQDGYNLCEGVSQQAMPSFGTVTFTVPANYNSNTFALVGFTYDSDQANLDWNTIDYGFYLTGNGYVCYESGSSITFSPQPPAVQPGDVISVQRNINGQISYIINGTSHRTVWESNPGAPLYVAYTMWGQGTQVDNLTVNNFTSTELDGYVADVQSYSDYYPFGMQMPERSEAPIQYRFKFQAQETDVEWSGGSITYKFRVSDPRIGRFTSRDPLTRDYPHYSPYSFSGNRLLDAVELEGLEPGRLRIPNFLRTSLLRNPVTAPVIIGPVVPAFGAGLSATGTLDASTLAFGPATAAPIINASDNQRPLVPVINPGAALPKRSQRTNAKLANGTLFNASVLITIQNVQPGDRINVAKTYTGTGRRVNSPIVVKPGEITMVNGVPTYSKNLELGKVFTGTAKGNLQQVGVTVTPRAPGVGAPAAQRSAPPGPVRNLTTQVSITVDLPRPPTRREARRLRNSNRTRVNRTNATF